MKIWQFAILALVGIVSKSRYINHVHNTNNEILFASLPSQHEAIVWSICQYHKHYQYPQLLFASLPSQHEAIVWSICQYHKHYQYPQLNRKGIIVKLLLLISGSVETNPGPRGPRQVKYPCGVRRKAVRANQEYYHRLFPSTFQLCHGQRRFHPCVFLD